MDRIASRNTMSDQPQVLDYWAPPAPKPRVSGLARAAVVCAVLGCPLVALLPGVVVERLAGPKPALAFMVYWIAIASFTGALLGVAGIVHICLAWRWRRGLLLAIGAIAMGAAWLERAFELALACAY